MNLTWISLPPLFPPPHPQVNPFRDRICRVFSHNDAFSFEDVLGMASVFSEQACPSLKIEYAFRIYGGCCGDWVMGQLPWNKYRNWNPSTSMHWCDEVSWGLLEYSWALCFSSAVDFFLTVEKYYSHGLMTSPPCHQRQMESSVLIFHDRSVGRPEREREKDRTIYGYEGVMFILKKLRDLNTETSSAINS